MCFYIEIIAFLFLIQMQTLRASELGISVEELNMRNEVQQAIQEMARQGRLGWINKEGSF